ncbi:transcriptional regulator [Kribbia dieselivorans]|uniref:transcriptional regulator n=1 Tax=Kribbia dieselivorans TaxID=331526 RepID=UPI0008385F04|nr:transcriptional regulator [Kribbia dieselivorans]
MNLDGFDETLHTPHRLRICVLLSEVDQAEFGLIRDTLEVADSVLSKQLKVLVDAGYVALDKPTGQGGRPRTWARLTRTGRTALRRHLRALQQMVEISQQTSEAWATSEQATRPA